MIKPRYEDRRATELSRCLCDIVLNRIAEEQQDEPQSFTYKGVLFFKIAEDSYQLRTFTKSTRPGALWTNIGPLHPHKLVARSARYLGIAYSTATPKKVFVYRIDPNLIIEHYERAGVPPLDKGWWCVRVSADPPDKLRFARSGDHEDVVVQVERGVIEQYELTGEELDALDQANTQSSIDDSGIEAGEDEAEEALSRFSDEVTEAFHLLIDELDTLWRECKEALIGEIRECQGGLRTALATYSGRADRLDSFRNRVTILRNEWLTAFVPEEALKRQRLAEEILDPAQETKEPAYKRMDWKRARGENTQFITERPDGAGPYINIIPNSVINEIAAVVAQHVKGRPSFTTSEILRDVRDFIHRESRYGRSPRTPVLCFVNACLKSDVLTHAPGFSRRYTLAQGRTEEDIREFSKKLCQR